MVDVWDADGKQLLAKLLEENPNWEAGLQEGRTHEDRFQVVHPRLHVPSEHPTIRTPLTIELGGTLQLFWYGGYFYDFDGDDIATSAFEFLAKFFSEEVRCGICLRDGEVVAGGPVEEDGLPSWIGDYDRIEVRSWRGNRDECVDF